MNCFVSVIGFSPRLDTARDFTRLPFLFKKKKKFLHACQTDKSLFLRKGKNLKKKFQNRQRVSRTLVFEIITIILSSMGFMETFYLFVLKLNETSVFCVSQTCSIVLNSAFSDLFGTPLVFWGLLSYSFIGFFSLYSTTSSQEIGKNTTFPGNLLLLFLILFGTFDVYFIFILENLLKTTCYWCLLSVFFSGSIFLSKSLSHTGSNSPDLNFLFFFTSFLTFLIFLNYIGNIVEMVGFLE